MGTSKYPDILQQNMNDLLHGLEFIRAYIYSLLILTKGDWKDYAHKLELTLNILKGNDLNVILKVIIWKNQNIIFRVLGHT